MAPKTIVVQVTSDVACPWCWVGKRAIETAAAHLAAQPSTPAFSLELHWHPFQLNPNLVPGHPKNLLQHFAALTRQPEVVAAWQQHPEQIPMNRSCVASKLPNITFSYSSSAVSYNTYAAHMLLTYAGSVMERYDIQNALKEAMLRMSHQESRNLESIPELTAAAREAGLVQTEAEVEAILKDEKVKKVLDEELKKAKQLPSFDGVPYFSFSNGKHFSGGQPVEVFEAALKELL